MLSIVILAMLAGGVFGTISGVVSAVEVLQTEQIRQTSRSALVELLRKGFASLPPRPVLQLKSRESNGQSLSELWIENAPGALAWGKDRAFSGIVVLGLDKTADGLLNLVVRRLSSDETARNRQIPEELTLVEGIRVLRWDFFDDQDRRWVGEWDDRARLPNLVRMEVQFQGDLEVEHITFALPWTTASNAQISRE
jgi:hypothetical protein